MNTMERKQAVNRMMRLALRLNTEQLTMSEDEFSEVEREASELQRKINESLEVEKKNKMGRPSLGITKKVSITLPPESWEWIDETVEYGHASSRSDFFRQVVQHAKEGKG